MRALLAGEPVTLSRPDSLLYDATLSFRAIQRPHPLVWLGRNNRRSAERAHAMPMV